MGRSTRQQAALNRETVVEAAAQLFRDHGLNGIGIADLMAAAGLTHGGFYRQFPSKDAVAGEACTRAMADALHVWKGVADAAAPPARLAALADAYLDRRPALNRCPMPTLAGDVAREAADSPVREAFTQGLRDFAELLTGCIDGPAPRDRALHLLAAMVGAVAIARASNDEAFAADIMLAVRQLAAS